MAFGPFGYISVFRRGSHGIKKAKGQQNDRSKKVGKYYHGTKQGVKALSKVVQSPPSGAVFSKWNCRISDADAPELLFGFPADLE